MAIVSKRESGGGSGLAILGWVAALALLALLVAFWWIASQDAELRNAIPSPGSAWAAAEGFPAQSRTAVAISATLGTWFHAFILAAAVGIPLGVLAGRSRGFAAIAAPSGFLFAAFPVVFAAPLSMLVFGVGSSAGPTFAAALLALGPVAAIAAWGQRSDDAAARVRSFFRALEFAALLALTGAIFAEMIGSQTGLGVDLMRSVSTLDSRRAFALAILVWTLAIVLTLPFAILRWLFGRALRG